MSAPHRWNGVHLQADARKPFAAAGPRTAEEALAAGQKALRILTGLSAGAVGLTLLALCWGIGSW